MMNMTWMPLLLIARISEMGSAARQTLKRNLRKALYNAL
jgi:hypothetical protein